jgi:hypothetical protein
LNRSIDDPLRLTALERLGPLAPPVARDALERGLVEIEADILAWEGSLGAIHGHRVWLSVDPELFRLISAAPVVVDSLTAALAAAMAERGGSSLAELKIHRREGAVLGTPYRGRP